MKELDDIRARADAATEGPWIEEFSGEQGNCVIPFDAQSTREAVAVTRLYYRQADAEFIAHAREDVPRLVAALEAVVSLANNLPEVQEGQILETIQGALRVEG